MKAAAGAPEKDIIIATYHWSTHKDREEAIRMMHHALDGLKKAQAERTIEELKRLKADFEIEFDINNFAIDDEMPKEDVLRIIDKRIEVLSNTHTEPEESK